MAAISVCDVAGARLAAGLAIAIAPTNPAGMNHANIALTLSLLLASTSPAFAAPPQGSGTAWEIVADLTTEIGPRLAGSDRELAAREWAAARLKALGVRLGNPNGAAALRRAGKGNGASVATIKANADAFAVDLREVLEDLRADGCTSLAGIAGELNARHIRTARGGKWHPSSVRNLEARLAA